MIFRDIQWYTIIYNGIHWYTMIYNNIQWNAIIYNDIQLFTMVYTDIQWYTIINSDTQWYTCHSKLLPISLAAPLMVLLRGNLSRVGGVSSPNLCKSQPNWVADNCNCLIQHQPFPSVHRALRLSENASVEKASFLCIPLEKWMDKSLSRVN